MPHSGCSELEIMYVYFVYLCMYCILTYYMYCVLICVLFSHHPAGVKNQPFLETFFFARESAIFEKRYKNLVIWKRRGIWGTLLLGAHSFDPRASALPPSGLTSCPSNNGLLFRPVLNAKKIVLSHPTKDSQRKWVKNSQCLGTGRHWETSMSGTL